MSRLLTLAVVGGSFAIAFLSVSSGSLIVRSLAAGVAAATLVAYTLFTRHLVREARVQTVTAVRAASDAEAHAAKQGVYARRAYEASLRSRADAGMTDTVISLRSATLGYGPRRISQQRDPAELGATERVMLEVTLSVTAYASRPVWMLLEKIPEGWGGADDSWIEPGVLVNDVVVLTLTREMPGSELQNALARGGWTDCESAWSVAPLHVRFTSLNGSVVDHHHLRLCLAPVFNETGRSELLRSVRGTLVYEHFPERHYRHLD